MRGQRGKQKSNADFNDAGKDIDRNSVAGRDAASCPSGMASTEWFLLRVRVQRLLVLALGCAGRCSASSGFVEVTNEQCVL